MRLLGFCQGLKPVGHLGEAFIPGGLGHSGVHVGVFVGFPGNRGLEVFVGRADRLAGCWIAGLFKKLEMAMSMAGLALGVERNTVETSL